MDGNPSVGLNTGKDEFPMFNSQNTTYYPDRQPSFSTADRNAQIVQSIAEHYIDVLPSAETFLDGLALAAEFAPLMGVDRETYLRLAMCAMRRVHQPDLAEDIAFYLVNVVAEEQ